MTKTRGTVLAATLLVAAACGMDQPTRPLAPGEGASMAKRLLTPVITDVTPSSATLEIGHSSAFTVAIANPAQNATAGGLSLSATIVQGNARRAAGDAIPCAGSGVLPPTTGCADQMTITPDNGAAGTGTLTPGNAKLVIELLGNNGATLDSKTLKVTLTSGGVFIADVQLHFSALEIGSTTLNTYTMTLGNGTGADQSVYVIQQYIVQGDVIHGSGGANVCDLTGIVPAAGCTFDWHAFASNASSSEPGTLVAGPAKLRIDLIHFDGVANTLVERREIDVTLTAP